MSKPIPQSTLTAWSNQTKGQTPKNTATISKPSSPAMAQHSPRPNSDFEGGANPFGPENYGGGGGGAKKPKGGAGTPSLADILAGLGPGGAAGASGIDPSLVSALHSQYDDQVKTVNDMYDRHLQHLDQLHANGVAGVNAQGASLQKALEGLALDATSRGHSINAELAKVLQQGRGSNQATYGSLAKDLKASGADGAGLQAELAGANQMLGNMGTLVHTDSINRQGDLSQALNNRQAEGQAMTTGSLNDMLAQLQSAQYNAEQQHTAQLGQAQQSRDAATAAAVRSSATHAPTLSSLISGAKSMFGTGHSPDVSNYFRTNAIHKNAAASAVANNYESQIASGKMTPAQALADWQTRKQQMQASGKGFGFALHNIDNALASAAADYSHNSQNQGLDPQSLLQYLALTGATR